MKAGIVCSVGLVLAALCDPAIAAAVPLSLSLEPGSVRIEGLAPDSRAVVLGVSRVGIESLVRLERFESIASDPSGGGSASVELPGGVSDRSVFVAVEISSGEWAIAYPEGYPQVAPPAAPKGAVAAAGFDQPGGLVELLWVRPRAGESSGAWGATVGDGGSVDADGLVDASVRVTPGAFGPVADGPPAPAALAAGDLVVVVSPDTLGAGVVRVSEGVEAGEGVGR